MPAKRPRSTMSLTSRPGLTAKSELNSPKAEEQSMRKIIYWVHTSVDGFIDGPNGEFDWPVMGPELSAYSEALDWRVDTLLFGRPVWETMVGFWPNAEAISQDPHVTALRTLLAGHSEDRVLPRLSGRRVDNPRRPWRPTGRGHCPQGTARRGPAADRGREPRRRADRSGPRRRVPHRCAPRGR